MAKQKGFRKPDSQQRVIRDWGHGGPSKQQSAWFSPGSHGLSNVDNRAERRRERSLKRKKFK